MGPDPILVSPPRDAGQLCCLPVPRGRKAVLCTKSHRASGGITVSAVSHHLTSPTGKRGGEGEGWIPVWQVERDTCRGYAATPKKPFPSLMLTDHRPREKTFSVCHEALSSPSVPGNTNKITPALLTFLFLDLLETEINSPTTLEESEKEYSGFDHFLEGKKCREMGKKLCAMLKGQEKGEKR